MKKLPNSQNSPALTKEDKLRSETVELSKRLVVNFFKAELDRAASQSVHVTFTDLILAFECVPPKTSLITFARSKGRTAQGYYDVYGPMFRLAKIERQWESDYVIL